MPDRLARAVEEKRVAHSSNFNTCQDISDLAFVNLSLVASDFVEFIPERQVHLNLLRHFSFHGLERLVHRVVFLRQ